MIVIGWILIYFPDVAVIQQVFTYAVLFFRNSADSKHTFYLYCVGTWIGTYASDVGAFSPKYDTLVG